MTIDPALIELISTGGDGAAILILLWLMKIQREVSYIQGRLDGAAKKPKKERNMKNFLAGFMGLVALVMVSGCDTIKAWKEATPLEKIYAIETQITDAYDEATELLATGQITPGQAKVAMLAIDQADNALGLAKEHYSGGLDTWSQKLSLAKDLIAKVWSNWKDYSYGTGGNQIGVDGGEQTARYRDQHYGGPEVGYGEIPVRIAGAY